MTDFLKPFLALRTNLNLKTSFKSNHVDIDNVIFKLHYRATALLLFVCSVLVTSRQYIGEHIKCIVGKSLDARVVSSYCFFTSTFTVMDHLDDDLVNNGSLPHLGVGPFYVDSKQEVIIHAYYQWVPFVLFGQALMFTLTHILWKKWEGGRLKALLVGLENASFAFAEKEIKGGRGPIPSIEKKKKGISLIKYEFLECNYVSKLWPIKLMMCEVLNVLHVVLQMYLTDKFLGGIFWSLGSTLLDDSIESKNVLDRNFPKVTKCSFQKYGPSGSIQLHDVLCVMALNVMNEKIYSVLWFWFVFLFAVSLANLIWRLVTICLHSKSPKFNRYVFPTSLDPMKNNEFNTFSDLVVTDYLPYKDWLFLKYLGKNVEGLLFKEIVNELTEGIHQNLSMENPDELYKLHS